jgi:hypothetical protein
MFLKNKYTKLYFKLTSSSDSSGYTENHHIIPKCLGGSDDTTNIVSLSARKHFLCHYLLIKMVPTKSPEFWKLIKAFNMMNSASDNQERYWNSRLYEKHRKLFTESMSVLQQGSNNSQYGKTWIYCPYTLISRPVLKSDLQTYLDNGCEKGRIVDIQKFIQKNKKKNITNKISKHFLSEQKYRQLLIDYYEKEDIEQIFIDWKSSKQSLIKYCESNLLRYKYKNLHVKFKKFNLISQPKFMWVCNSENKIIKIKIEDFSKYKHDGFKKGRRWNSVEELNLSTPSHFFNVNGLEDHGGDTELF